MPVFLLPILGFAKQYWKQISIVIGVLLVVWFIYHKGVRDCEQRVEHATHKEIEKRFEKDQKEQDRLVKIDRKIDTARTTRPMDDQRDSCLLSNDPYKMRCVND